MPVSLAKGGNVNLTAAAPGLRQITVGLGWDARATDGAPFDLDASAFILIEAPGGRGYKLASDADFVFYNNLQSSCGSVRHTGDNITGAGDGDDESIKIDLTRVPLTAAKVRVCVSINDAEARKQNFGQVRNAFIRVVDDATGAESARYDLSEDASTETAMIFGELYRHASDWKFRAVGQGFAGGLVALLADVGVSV